MKNIIQRIAYRIIRFLYDRYCTCQGNKFILGEAWSVATDLREGTLCDYCQEKIKQNATRCRFRWIMDIDCEHTHACDDCHDDLKNIKYKH